MLVGLETTSLFIWLVGLHGKLPEAPKHLVQAHSFGTGNTDALAQCALCYQFQAEVWECESLMAGTYSGWDCQGVKDSPSRTMALLASVKTMWP